MKFSSKLKNLLFKVLFFILSLSTVSCSSKENQTSIYKKVNLEKDSLQLISHSGIEFEIEMEGSDLMGTGIKGYVYNKSKKSIYYISESCYSLQPFLCFDSKNVHSITSWDCSTNRTIVKILNPGDTIRFSAIVFTTENERFPKRIGLDFRTVNKPIGENELRQNNMAMYNINTTPTLKENVIWTNVPN